MAFPLPAGADYVCDRLGVRKSGDRARVKEIGIEDVEAGGVEGSPVDMLFRARWSAAAAKGSMKGPGNRMANPLVDIRGLTFTYPEGEFRLTVPELTVGGGERIAVIGPSGSGKTTLLNLVAGIFPPAGGRVTVGETEVSALGDAARRDFRITTVGFVFQDFELLDYLTVRDNILHPYRITGALKLDAAVGKRAEELAESMGIAEHLSRRPDSLSQGERQRAAICRALLPRPRLILADEATGNLDPRNKAHILDLLFEAVEKHGATLLAVTHDHELLPRFDRVVDFAAFREEGEE